MITLYSKDGLTEKAEIKKFTYNGQFLGECFISATITSPAPINFEIGDYCIFRGERFELNYIPAKEKQATANSYGDAFVYDNIKFNSLADELTRVDFIDIVLPDNNIHYTSKPDFSFYAGSVKDLADRIQANLNAEFTGDKAWNVVVLPELVTPDRNITVSGLSVWEALALVSSEFAANFIIRNRTITIGTSGYAVGAVFGYGKGNGLYDIQQNTNQDAKIITRLRAYGSMRNLPNRYYNKLKDENDQPYISESAYIPNLMLPDFPIVQNDPKRVYIESDNIAEYGVRYGHVYFDGSDENTEIYPSLEGMTAAQLAAAGIIVSSPSGDNGNIDEVLGADNPTDNGEIPENPESIDGQFTIYLKDLGFDLSEKDSSGNYVYATTDTMQINMRSGMCVGRTFDIIDNGITKDTSLGYVRFKVICNRFTDDSVDMAYPNSQYHIDMGDKFVLLGISMPDVYIKAASQRLLASAWEYLSQNDSTKYTYTPKIDEIFMARHPEIGDSIKEGDIFNFTDTDLDIDASVIIQNLKITYDLSSKAIPTYEVSLGNDRISTTIQKIQSAISSLQQNVTGLSIDSVKALINSIGTSRFLSKNFDDTAKGLIKFVKGLNVGDYTSGAFGSGGAFRMNNGDSEIEVDRLTVRKIARFFEVLIERMSHIGGANVLSPARMICSKVDEQDDSYRCYFETGDNNEFVQEFVIGDQARCQVFNGSTQKYYWRLVTGIGEDYIDLSKSDFDTGSGVPAVGDHIFQLGNRTDTTRQNAQIMSSFGTDAPSYKQYQGINSYSLVDTEKTVISPEGNRFEGAMTIEAGSLGWENLVGLPEEFQSLSTGAVNLIRNSGFNGDYTSKKLTSGTQLQSNTQLFSEQLIHWDGSATINIDGDSTSGYSATLIDHTISQQVPTINTENYILSFKAKGESISVNVSGFTKTQALISDYNRYVIKLQSGDTQLLSITGRCTICEIQLERGTIPSEWTYSPLDNDKTLAQFNAIRYITDSVKNGSTTILGGLILSSMIQLGNYVNGQMKKVTSGMSGIYNDDTDVAFWAGGELSKAIANAVTPFTTDKDRMINFLVTHGGLLIANNAIIRGTIFATDGEFNGKVSIAGGKILLNKDGSGQLANGNISWDAEGNPIFNGIVTSTDEEGNLITLNAKNKRIELKNKYGDVMGRWSYFVPVEGEGAIYGSTIILNTYSKYGDLTSPLNRIIVGGEGIVLEDFNSGETYNIGFSTAFLPKLVNIKNMPTSIFGLNQGDIWRDGELVKVVV